MSLTPIFDATLADAPQNIWEASPIFPRPTKAFTFERPDLIGWADTLLDPTNLSFLRNVA